MNKKGWIRIVEAFLAIILIAGFLLYITSAKAKVDRSKEIYELERQILNEIALDAGLRQAVLNNNLGSINNYVSKRIPADLAFEIKICEIGVICAKSTYIEQDVYADDTIISSTLATYSPKKLKMFVWEK